MIKKFGFRLLDLTYIYQTLNIMNSNIINAEIAFLILIETPSIINEALSSIDINDIHSIKKEAIIKRETILSNLKDKFIEMFNLNGLISSNNILESTDGLELHISINDDIEIIRISYNIKDNNEFQFDPGVYANYPTFSLSEYDEFKVYLSILTSITTEFKNVKWDKLAMYIKYINIWMSLIEECDSIINSHNIKLKKELDNVILTKVISNMNPFPTKNSKYTNRIKKSALHDVLWVIHFIKIPHRNNAKYITCKEEIFNIKKVLSNSNELIAEELSTKPVKSSRLRIPLASWREWLYDNGFLDFEKHNKAKDFNQIKQLQ
jgi:hypothetical protein